MLNILTCVKRVPATGSWIVLTEDHQEIETRYLGFAVSPHEECAIEEAVQLVEKHGGKSTVLTLGPPEAEQQLREGMAMGIDEGILIETEVSDWPPMPTAEALVETIRAREAESGEAFNLLLFGNESADSGGYQVGMRVAHALGLPCVSGVKHLEIEGEKITARREAYGGWEIYEVDMPAVIMVKEGINLPRYPSFRGKMQAKKKTLHTSTRSPGQGGLVKSRLQNPPATSKEAVMLGDGAAAVPKIVETLKELGVVPS
jgi:electron transfer flavoprotein beta subunit